MTKISNQPVKPTTLRPQRADVLTQSIKTYVPDAPDGIGHLVEVDLHRFERALPQVTCEASYQLIDEELTEAIAIYLYQNKEGIKVATRDSLREPAMKEYNENEEVQNHIKGFLRGIKRAFDKYVKPIISDDLAVQINVPAPTETYAKMATELNAVLEKYGFTTKKIDAESVYTRISYEKR